MEGNRPKTEIWEVGFLRDLHGYVSEKGINMAYEQYCLARDSLLDPIEKPLKPFDRTKSPPVVTARERLPLELFDVFWSGRKAIYEPPRNSTVSRLRIASSQTTDDPADAAQDRANSGLQSSLHPPPRRAAR
ncbi:unnamed protein product, partial [Clonostachys chloroleuca]